MSNITVWLFIFWPTTNYGASERKLGSCFQTSKTIVSQSSIFCLFSRSSWVQNCPQIDSQVKRSTSVTEVHGLSEWSCCRSFFIYFYHGYPGTSSCGARHPRCTAPLIKKTTHIEIWTKTDLLRCDRIFWDAIGWGTVPDPIAPNRYFKFIKIQCST